LHPTPCSVRVRFQAPHGASSARSSNCCVGRSHRAYGPSTTRTPPHPTRPPLHDPILALDAVHADIPVPLRCIARRLAANVHQPLASVPTRHGPHLHLTTDRGACNAGSPHARSRSRSTAGNTGMRVGATAVDANTLTHPILLAHASDECTEIRHRFCGHATLDSNDVDAACRVLMVHIGAAAGTPATGRRFCARI
jgi:hypothetical protein